MTSTPDQVLAVLKLLSEYYRREPNETQAGIYLEALAELDPFALQECARQWIRRSPFFPRVNELLQIAREIPKPAPDVLAYRLQALEDAFYEERTLDPQAWLALADDFERADRPHRALHTRQKLAAFQSILEQESLRISPDDIFIAGRGARARTERSRSGEA